MGTTVKDIIKNASVSGVTSAVKPSNTVKPSAVTEVKNEVVKNEVVKNEVVKNEAIPETLTFQEYKNLAIKTAVFPDSVKYIYPVIGVCDELMEYSQSKKLDEIGDVMWYMAACSHTLGIEFEHVNKDVYDLELCIGKLIGRVKKFMRGDYPAKDYVEAVTPALNEIYTWAHVSFGNLSLVYKQNIEKLYDRRDRGVLKGDGDAR